MSGPQDPLQRESRDRDLYDVATWEPRTTLDAVSVRLHAVLQGAGRTAVVALAALILAGQFALVAAVAREDPVIAVYILLSVVPALGLTALVWRSDVTRREPLRLLVVTFTLGVLFAGFAAVVNSAFQGLFFGLGTAGVVGFFFLIVGPVEETVKWLAIRLHAFRSGEFDAVVDGAVYGAVAGLGFATIENALYITQHVLEVSQATGGGISSSAAPQIAAARSFAGPGHVIYSGFAGYYLGLAKFNRRRAGPIVVKGLLIASVIHAVYNVSVTFLPGLLAGYGVGTVGIGLAFIGFVAVYDGVFFFVLYRKLSRYRRLYRDLGAERSEPDGVDRTEFDRDVGE